MTSLIATVLWCLLFLLCWPLAILALAIWPIVWLITLPFRLIGIVFTGVFAVLTAIILLPARLLGWRPKPTTA